MRTRENTLRLQHAAADAYLRLWRQTPNDPLVLDLAEALEAVRDELDAESAVAEPETCDVGAA